MRSPVCLDINVSDIWRLHNSLGQPNWAAFNIHKCGSGIDEHKGAAAVNHHTMMTARIRQRPE